MRCPLERVREVAQDELSACTINGPGVQRLALDLLDLRAERDALREQRGRLVEALDYLLQRSKHGLTHKDWSIERVEELLEENRD